jgi:serine/threonine-protein kinase
MTSDPLEGCDGYQYLRSTPGPAPLESHVARDLRRDEEVLIRLFPRELLVDADALDRLRAAVDRIDGLDHPNIAKVREVGRTGVGRAFVSTELGAGRLLREQLGQFEGRPQVLRVLELACGAMRGLEAAEEQGVSHGALCLDSLCLSAPDPDGSRSTPKGRSRLQVIDLGIAAVMEGEGADWGPSADCSIPNGTESPSDPRWDVFLAGAMLYELLAGRHPFDGDLGATATRRRPEAIEPPSRYAPSQEMGPELDAAVLRSLEPDPEDRYQSVKAFRVALEGVAALIRQVSLPGNLEWSDDGFSVEVPRASDGQSSSEPESEQLVFTPAPSKVADDESRSSPTIAAADPNGVDSDVDVARPRALVAVVAAAAIVVLALVAYLVN